MNLLAVVTLIGFEKVATFVVMLSVLIVLHELGHFVLARRNGVRVNEFAVGFGPRLASWTSPRSGTQYSLRAFPIGGFCAMEGEDGKASEAEQQRSFRAHPTDTQTNFQAKSPWRRLAIILAGPAANFLLCYAILLVGALVFGVASDTTNQPVVREVISGSPADKGGVRPGDRIVAIDGVAMTTGKKLVDTIHGALGKRLHLVYLRNGIRTDIYVSPRPCPPQVGRNFGCIGFSPVPAFERVGFVAAVRQSADQFAVIADETVEGIVLLVTQFAKYSPQIAGPIGMGQAAATVQDWGWGPYLSFAATISFALGLFNLLPIPALDGGRAAFIIAELIRGRPVDPEKEAMVHLAGFAALIALVMLVAFHDITRIVKGQGVL
ncbi:MAG TPA: M50 family metallopeptidase [Candidatus Cybelea sp.]|nr:M50 family metallopeptidase [Candidatus Cybelea sp.]